MLKPEYFIKLNKQKELEFLFHSSGIGYG